MAHPTCEKVNVTLVDGPGIVQNVTVIAKGLTEVNIQATQAGKITISVSADPDSSLNPAFIAVIPEFQSLILLLFLIAGVLLAVIIPKRTKHAKS